MKEIEFKEVKKFNNYLNEMNQENYLIIAIYLNNNYIGIFQAQAKNLSVKDHYGFHIIVLADKQHFIITCDKINVLEVIEHE